MNNLNDVLGKITDFLKSEAKTETIVGQPFTLGEFTCVPVMSVGIGFGGGGGEGKAQKPETSDGTGAAGAGGMGMAPIGFLATKGSDIQFISVQASKGLGSVFEKLPGLLEKFIDKNKKTATEKV